MSLLHRLSLFQKFIILGLIGLSMSALPTFLYVSTSLNDIASARREVTGAAPLFALNKLVQLMQVHRGLSASMLSGNAELGARRPAVRDAIGKALDEVDTRLKAAQVSSADASAWSQAKPLCPGNEMSRMIRSTCCFRRNCAPSSAVPAACTV